MLRSVLWLLCGLLILPCQGQGGESEVRRSDGWFTDIAASSGLDFLHEPAVEGSYSMPESIGSGGALFDYDDDGDLDVYLLNGAPRPTAGKPAVHNRLFRQEGDGRFREVTEVSGLGDGGYGMGVAVGDVDNDGDLDVYLTNYGADALYRNRGDGSFVEATRESGIDNPAWGCSTTFLDWDLDGWLDLYVTNYVAYDPAVTCVDPAGRPDYCGPAGFSGVPDVLYRNAGAGIFHDVSGPSGIARVAAKGLGVVAADFNGDRLPDLYVANDGEANLMWINRGDGRFADEAVVMGSGFNELGRPEAGMGIAVGDADGDGGLDLFVTHLRTESNTFYRHAGAGGWADVTSAVGLAGVSLPYTGFGTGFFDYDHDGDLDLAVVNGRVTRGPLLSGNRTPGYWDPYAEPNLLFANDGRGRFHDVSVQAGDLAAVENSRGLAFGDVDNDGDVDLLVSNEGGRARLLRNDAGGGNWLLVRVVDAGRRRDAIGAKLTVKVGEERRHRLLAAGYSFLSSSDSRVHFGLGAAGRVEGMTVEWPTGRRLRLTDLPANRVLVLRWRAGDGG